MHILPFWYAFIYWFLWIAGAALALIFMIYLLSRLVKHLNTRPAREFASDAAKHRQFTAIQLKRDLKIIHDDALTTKKFREGCHRMSAVLKTYFEILLKLDIEEMTADEIRVHVKEKEELGMFFTSLTVTQYQHAEPSEEQVTNHYSRALELVKS